MTSKSLLLIGCFFLFSNSLFAQWPPKGNTPSAAMQHFHLPGARFVPSTKRFNLVWADQLIPEGLFPKQLQFAAEHYVGTQKIWDYQAADFRTINPNFLVLIYHLAAGLNPLHNYDPPDPKTYSDSGFIGDVTPKGYDSEFKDYFIPWLAAHGITDSLLRREQMFQHYDNAIDSLHRVWHQDPAWLMNLRDTNWQNYCGDVCLDWMKGNTDDGCFFDVAVETNSFLYNPKQSDAPPYDFDWWIAPHGPAADRGEFSLWQNETYLQCYKKIYKRFHSDTLDYLVIPNTDQMVTTVYDPVWTDGDTTGETIDGAMMEDFGTYRGQDMWLTLERGLRHLTGRGKILIAQFSGVDSAERLRRTAMYMLIKNENTFLNILNSNVVEWYPEYEIDLGEQSSLPRTLDSLRIAGSDWHSVWARDYAWGKVYCNTSDAAITIDLPSVGTWAKITTSGGGTVDNSGTRKPQKIILTAVSGKLTIPASGGVILQRTDINAVRNSETSLLSLNIYPNPVRNSATIRLVNEKDGVASISVINILGEEIKRIFSGQLNAGEHTFNWNVQNIPAGSYTCVVTTPSGIRTSSLILIK